MLKFASVALAGVAIGFCAAVFLMTLPGASNSENQYLLNRSYAAGLVSAMVMARQHNLATDANSINNMILSASLTSHDLNERPEKLFSMGIVTMDMVRSK